MSKSMFPQVIFLKSINFSFYRNYIKYRQSKQADIFAVSVVLYDHACPLCRSEMQRLQRRDQCGRLVLLDINSPAFNEHTWGISRSQAARALHVLTPDNEWLVGMAAIRHVYARVGLGWMLSMTQWPLFAAVADRVYQIIAPNRHVISRWLGLDTSSHCNDGACGYVEHDNGGVRHD